MNTSEIAQADEALRERLRKRAADPIRLQYLEKMVDLTRFLQQLEKLLAMPIKIPGTSVLPYPGSSN
uniref:Uncharacterized protein n=2 Tax=Ascarididae TaxID=6250 RepID=A0A915ACM0_PARUN